MKTTKKASAMIEKYNLDSSCGCVEPGYNDKPVLLGNWNDIPGEVFDYLESKGFSCEWEDEWLNCDECYKSFRSSPNSYGWEMFGYIGDGFAVCGNCIDWDTYLESLENKPRKAVTCSLFYNFEDEITSRYTLIKDDFENGFYPGQNDDPQKILAELLKTDPDGRFLFVIDSQRQFDIGFSVYKRNQS